MSYFNVCKGEILGIGIGITSTSGNVSVNYSVLVWVNEMGFEAFWIFFIL
jgi:hypothetical protein